MSSYLDREGIFKVRPITWRVKGFEGKKSIAIALEFVVLAQLNEANEWEPWDGYAEVRVWGDYFVVKKDGTPNVGTCEQLAASMGWTGSLRMVASGPPPECVVQVTVKADTYNNETRYKAGWMNPGDYVPSPGGASAEEIDAMDAQFGSLLRAAASSAKKAAPPKAAAKPKPAATPMGEPTKTVADHGDIPF
jgi:hypothetical protein